MVEINVKIFAPKKVFLIFVISQVGAMVFVLISATV